MSCTEEQHDRHDDVCRCERYIIRLPMTLLFSAGQAFADTCFSQVLWKLRGVQEMQHGSFHSTHPSTSRFGSCSAETEASEGVWRDEFGLSRFSMKSSPVKHGVDKKMQVRTKRTNLPVGGKVSIDRSMVAALLSTTPRLVPRSSTDDSVLKFSSE